MPRQSISQGELLTFERVYTVTDYWDGPREGIADFQDVPHLYRSIFLKEDDEASRASVHRTTGASCSASLLCPRASLRLDAVLCRNADAVLSLNERAAAVAKHRW